jgi:hypothetical protein
MDKCWKRVTEEETEILLKFNIPKTMPPAICTLAVLHQAYVAAAGFVKVRLLVTLGVLAYQPGLIYAFDFGTEAFRSTPNACKAPRLSP